MRGIFWFRNHIVNFALEANDFLAVRQDQGRQAGDKADWARVGKGSGRKIAWTAILMADFAKAGCNLQQAGLRKNIYIRRGQSPVNSEI